MKSLDEVHAAAAAARSTATPINATTCPGDATHLFIITQPGAYYLPENVTVPSGQSGILVSALNVSIDLGGHVIEGLDGSLYSVYSLTSSYTALRNGTLTGGGSLGTLLLLGNYARVEDVDVVSSATSGSVVIVGGFSRVSRCTVTNGGVGISADVHSIVEQCLVRGTTSAAIRPDSYCQVIGNHATDCAFGIVENAGGHCIIKGNILERGETGMNLCADNEVTENILYFASATGIQVRCGKNRVSDNKVYNCTTAVLMSANGEEAVFSNIISGSTTNFGGTTGNFVAPTGNPGSATNPFTNFVLQ